MKRCSIFCLLVCLSAAPLLAGVIFEIETTDHHGGEPTVVEVSAEGPNMKMQIPAGRGKPGGEMIFRGEKREMVFVDHDKKEFMVMDQEMVKSMSAQINQAMSEMEKALENVPEEQRAMVEKMMKQRMPAAAKAERPTSEIKNTGESATKNGYPCVKYEVWNGGARISEMWVTDWKNIEGGDEVVRAFQQMSEFFREWMDSLSEAAGKMGGLGMNPGDNPFEHMKDMNGFPVVAQQFEGDTVKSASSLLSAKRQAIDAGTFDPPSGYKQKNMMKAMQGR